MEFQTATDIAKFMEMWNAAGLDADEVAPVPDLLARRKAIGQEHVTLKEETRSATDEVIDRLIAGELGFADAVSACERITAVDRGGGTGFSVGSILTQAVDRRVRARVGRFLRTNAGRLEEIIDAAAEKLRAEARKLASALRGVDSTGAAMAAGSKASNAWSKVTALEDQRMSLVQVRGLLTRYGGLPESETLSFRPTLFTVVHAENDMAEVAG